MDSARVQFHLTALLLLVGAAAINAWMFRLGLIWGLIGLSLLKHILVAWICQVVGVNRGRG